MPAAGAIGVVKRLSTKSGKRMIAFKNEVELMSKLRHRNLMRILGCFVELVEKMLIYKYCTISYSVCSYFLINIRTSYTDSSFFSGKKKTVTLFISMWSIR